MPISYNNIVLNKVFLRRRIMMTQHQNGFKGAAKGVVILNGRFNIDIDPCQGDQSGVNVPFTSDVQLDVVHY